MDEESVQNRQGQLYLLGARGYSAYEVAVLNGYIGTEEEWLESLVGPQGEPGTPFGDLTPEQKEELRGPQGKSAYQVAVDNGFIGTEQEWVNSFLTPDGYYNKDEIDLKKATFVNSVNEMKESDLKENTFVVTAGYYEINDGGNALYKIVDDDTLTEDGWSIIELNNGLFATLIVKDNSLNIKQLGAYGDGIHNDTSYLQYFANSDFKTLIFPSGKYNIDDVIDFEDKELIGIENPVIDIIGITTSREHTIHISGRCHIKGINFEQSIANTNIMGLYHTNNTLIENCSFKVNDVKCNGYFDLYTNNHNVKVLNCDFDCVSTETVEGVKVNAIGGIWVRQFHNDYTSDNIIFENCVISHQSKDEAMGVWNDKTPCLLSNVQINNCIIKDKAGATNPHLITFNANDSSINNCILERYTENEFTISSMIHQRLSTGVMGEINNCIINTNVTHINGILNSGKLIYNNCVINDSSEETRLIVSGKIMNSTINCVSFQNQFSDITIQNCELNISEQTHTWLFRHTCNLLNNVFNFIGANPTSIIYVVDAEDTGDKFYLKGNTFNLHEGDLITTANMHSSSGNEIYAYDNVNIGNVTNEGTCTGVLANNILCRSELTYTYIKTNNNFNINA